MNTLDLIFTWFLSATLRGSLLAVVVIVIGFALRGRMPARWRYALWLPVLFVLVAPRLPQSSWSAEGWLIPFVTSPTRTAMADEAGSLKELSGGDGIATAQGLSGSAREGGFAWRRVAAGVWLTGALGVLFFALVTFARTLRRMRRAVVPAQAPVEEMLREAATIAEMRRPPELIVSTAVQSPAVCGFLRSIILLPAEFPGTLTANEARLVLLHELMHLKSRDLLLNWLLCVLQAVHWCNPLLWFAFARMRADREAACDARVLEATKNDCRADYGHALLKLESTQAPTGLGLGFVGIFERTSGVGLRIRAIAAHRRTHPVWSVLGSVSLIALALTGATRAQGPTDGRTTAQPAPVAEIRRKLDTIVIPKVEFREATIADALSYLVRQSVELDTAESDPAKRGVKIVLNLNAGDPALQPEALNPLHARITVSLRDIPLVEAVKYVTSLTNLKFRLNARGVEVVPVSAPDLLASKDWVIPPKSGLAHAKNVREVLEANGVTFPQGAAVALSSDGRKLIMRNTQENLDLVEPLLGAASLREAAAAEAKGPLTPEEAGVEKINRKLNAIIIPRLELRGATLREAVDLLKKKSAELDTTEADVSKRGINIVLKLDARSIPGLEPRVTEPQPLKIPPLNWSVENISLAQALEYVSKQAGVKVKVEPYAVALVPPGQ